ncbi:MAG: ABC transporter permease [Desulfotalea sp.]
MKTNLSFSKQFAWEAKDFIKDPWIFSFSTWVPILLFIALWALFKQGLIHEQAVGVIDLDNSVLSRKFISSYDASSVINIKSYTSQQLAFAALHDSNILGLIIIPKNLSRDTTKKLQPQITAFINHQYLLMGKQINAALRRAHATALAKIKIGNNLIATPMLKTAMATAFPIRVQSTALANINSNYGQFLVTAMIPAAWQIFLVGVTVLSIGSIKRRFGLQKWLQTENRPYLKLSARMCVLTIIFWLQGSLFLWAMSNLADWPMRGSWPFLLFALLLTVVGCQGAGCLFFAITWDATRAMSFCAAFTAPALAFLGVTFPASDMTTFAQVWRSLLPIVHFSEIQIAQSNFAIPPMENLQPITFLALFCLLLPMAFYILNKRGQK